MCKCNPSVKTPYCGKLGCEWPKNEIDTGEVEPGKYRKEDLVNRLSYAERLLSRWIRPTEEDKANQMNSLALETEGFLHRR